MRQPAGIAFAASIGVHGLLGISLPLLSPPETETPDRQQRVQVVELSPDQARRLPQSVLPQSPTASVPVPGNQFSPNWLRPSLPNGNNPGYSLTPLPGFPNLYRLPTGLNTYNQPQTVTINPSYQGAPLRQPDGLRQLPTQRSTVAPLFDDNILQTRAPQWNVTPDSPNLQISGKPPQSPSPSATQSPQPSPQSPEASPTATPASPAASPTTSAISLQPVQVELSPSSSPTQPATSPQPASPDNLLAYNSDGTGQGDAAGRLAAWQEQIQSSGVVTSEGNSWQPLPLKVSPPERARSLVEKADRPIRAIVGVLVDADGKVVGEPSLIQSSGYELLNQAAINAVINHDYSSTGVKVPYLITLEFKL